jgi:GT2 family glycosyltransferase
MVTFLENHPEAHMISPKIKIYKSKDHIWYAGAEIDLRKFDLVKIRGLWESDPENKKYNEVSPTGYIAGTAVFLRREILEKLGLLDDILFMYHDDPDWSLRARKLGYHLYYVPSTIIYHDISLVDINRSIFNYYFLIRNSQILVWKHGNIQDLFWYYWKFLKEIINHLFYDIRNGNIDLFQIRLNAVIRGFKIGIKRRTNHVNKKNFTKEYNYIKKVQKF